MTTCDFLIIGGGIAGASAAFELAQRGSAIVLEREDQPGYHSTGRSAALYTENYGNATLRGLTIAIGPFFDAPPDGFTDHPLLTPRQCLFIAREDQRAAFDALLAEAGTQINSIEEIDLERARALNPALDPTYVVSVMHEPDAMDMDVHGIHQGFLKGLRARGGGVVTDAEVTALERSNGVWRVESPAGTFRAPVVVNAGGAWWRPRGGLGGYPADRAGFRNGAPRLPSIRRRMPRLTAGRP